MNRSDLPWQIPLQFIGNGIPLVVLPAFVNEAGPFQFILDTGNATAPFILSRRLAEQLSIDAQSNAQFAKPNVVGSEEVELLASTADSISIGPIREEGIRVGVSKAMDQLSRAIGAEIDGNIGYLFLKDLRITLDYPQKIFRIDHSKHDSEDCRAIDFELGSPKRLILTWTKVNGVRYRFAFDTGAGGTIVSSEMAQNLSLIRGADVPIQGAGGRAKGFFTEVASLEFGNISLRDVTVVAADVFASLRHPAGGELDGIIGYNVMQQFRVTIDYPMKRMRFES